MGGRSAGTGAVFAARCKSAQNPATQWPCAGSNPMIEALPKAVVLVSGGMDSCVSAAIARQTHRLAFAHASYGQLTERRERHGNGSRGHDGSTNLLGQYGPLDHRGTGADELRPRRQPFYMAHDTVCGRDGASGFSSSTVSPSTIGREPSSSHWLWPQDSLPRCCL